jgi:hypothetical protein
MDRSLLKSIAAALSAGLLVLSFVFIRPKPANAIPSFARKYGLPCSACHEAWPKLNNFGIVFRDNGYQLGNERDSPIWYNPAYIPFTLRMTPQWHHEKTNRVGIDSIAGDPNSPQVESRLTTAGFDLSGMDLLTAGTLYKNISFLLVPSADSTGAFHFESANVRFDNLFGSRWLNLKFGKHELDMPEGLSEKRELVLSANGGFYQVYHFIPLGDINDFGMGDNQLGMELVGHSRNSYTRYAVSVLSSNSGNVGLPSGNTYDVYGHFSQAFNLPRLGLQRVGVFGYDGRRPTYFLTSGGVPIAGAGLGSAPFYRAGLYGTFYINNFDFTALYMHSKDNKFLANANPTNSPQTLPIGARAAVWNGGVFEAHYTYNPQLVVFGKYELIRMAQQGSPDVNSDLGNNNTFTVGYRWYPIMFSRAGLAFHNEYSRARSVGTSPITGRDTVSDSVFVGLDFDF